MGIRIAIGASYWRLLRMVLREGMVPAWFGVAFGMVLSIIAAKSLIAIVFPLKHGIDMRLLLLAAPLLVAVALAAAYFPARRAARVSPTEALRTE
jgi:ABC-type antimicrobial peptide transport system permease subunit